jgi:hypothetical protein
MHKRSSNLSNCVIPVHELKKCVISVPKHFPGLPPGPIGSRPMMTWHVYVVLVSIKQYLRATYGVQADVAAPQLEVVGAPPPGREGRSPTAFTTAALGNPLPAGPSAVATSALPAASTVAALDTPPPAGPLRPTKAGNASSSLADGAEQRPSRTACWLYERHPCPAAVLPPPRFVPLSALNGSRRRRPWSSCRARARPSGDCLPATQTHAQTLLRQPRSSRCARTSPAPLAASCRLSLRLSNGHGGRARDGSSGDDGKSSRCALRRRHCV